MRTPFAAATLRRLPEQSAQHLEALNDHMVEARRILKELRQHITNRRDLDRRLMEMMTADMETELADAQLRALKACLNHNDDID